MNLEPFKRYVKDLRHSNNNQYVGRCPFHDDKKASLSINMDRGVYNCHGCGAKGNAYTMAEQLGHENPKQFLDKSVQSVHYKNTQNTQYSYKKENIQNIQYEPKKDYTRVIEKYVHNLKDNIDVYPPIWDKTLIEDLNLGYCTTHHKIVYAYENEGYKIHNTTSSTGLTKRWYLGHKINDYSIEKPLYICEGEKDTITLVSHLKQAVSVSGGCMSMPNDEMLQSIKDFQKIIICYDNDDAGRIGGRNLADRLLNSKVEIIKWAEHCKDKYDVTDSFTFDESAEFTYALNNAEKIDKAKLIGGLEMIDGFTALNMDITPRKQIIENILPEKSQIILGGTTGTNKSFMAMQMGMSIANNEKEFLGFKINEGGLSVLFCDTECGKQTLIERYQSIVKNFKWNPKSRFNFVTNKDSISNIYDDLEKAIGYYKPDIVIIDCLYNTTDGADISVNAKITPTLKRITKIKNKYNVTIVLVHHMNKGNHEQGLVSDRMSGGSALQNWSEHINLITKTNQSSTRLFKVAKSRHTYVPECYYALSWEKDICMLVNEGVVNDWKKLLISTHKKNNWIKVLRDLGDEFTTSDIINVFSIRGYVEKTARNHLRDMCSTKVVKKIGHGKYKKALKIFDSEA